MSKKRGREPHPGITVEDGREVMGLVHPAGTWLSDRDTVIQITATRIPGDIRATWPADVQAREHQLWTEIADADRAYLSLRLQRASFEEMEKAQRKRTRLTKKYHSIGPNPEIERARQVKPSVRQAVFADWEANGRICSICGLPVASSERGQIHHKTPVQDGGTRARENLGVAHALCNHALGSGGWVYHGGPRGRSCPICAQGSGPCAICGQQTCAYYGYNYQGEPLVHLHVCPDHRRHESVMEMRNEAIIAGLRRLVQATV